MGPTVDKTAHRMLLYLDRALQQDTLADFAGAKTEVVKENLQSIEVLKDKEITQSGGNPVHEFVVRWMPVGNYAFIKRYVFILANDVGFTFRCDFSDSTFKKLRTDMNKLIEHLVPNTFISDDGATPEQEPPPAPSTPPVQNPPPNPDHLW